jgi:hypothetical protein
VEVRVLAAIAPSSRMHSGGRRRAAALRAAIVADRDLHWSGWINMSALALILATALGAW